MLRYVSVSIGSFAMKATLGYDDMGTFRQSIFILVRYMYVRTYANKRQAAESPQPVDGITGYECPQGTYCPEGSSAPLGCPPGTYNPSMAMGNCTECPAGSICLNNATTPAECPMYHYCPAGSSEGTMCPAGTYGNRVRSGEKSGLETTLFLVSSLHVCSPFGVDGDVGGVIFAQL